ncbi:MAG: site-2 protease family protein [Christensenellales bacterium]
MRADLLSIKNQVLAFASVIRIMLQYTIIININLMVFNLPPIPPLDGYKAYAIFDWENRRW